MQYSFINLLLSPFAFMYTAVIGIRRYLYKIGLFRSKSSPLPTFCVGNVVVGGSGKSPFTSFLAQQLKQMGYKPAILLRGYKGKEIGPIAVNPNNKVEDVGDEALMHLQNGVPVIVAKKRIAGAEFIQKNKLANCIIMDDGLQHLAIKAQHNFLLLDVSNQSSIKKWQQGLTLPAGRLREPLSWALKKTDSVILVNKMSEEFPVFNLKSHFNFKLSTDKLIDLYNKESAKLMGECNILCAIANPESFIAAIENLGLKIQKKYIFKDHYELKESEWKKIKLDLPLIITSKDAVKIKKYALAPKQIFVLEQTGNISNNSDFQNLLKDVMNAK